MMRLLPLVALLLAGCASQGPPAIEVRTIEVPIAVPVACVDPSQIPAMPPTVSDRLTGNAAVDVRIVAISALELRAALGEALALLRGCGG